MRTHIALLRGINVGGKNKVPMNDLAAAFTAAGCRDVQTYIQSGNVVFGASTEVAGNAAESVAARFAVPVLLRTAEELRSVVSDNPFVAAGVPEDQLHVVFLATTPPADVAAVLQPSRFAPDELAVHGREIYLWLPNGVSQSRIAKERLDMKLQVVNTMRNWRTTTKLLELLQG